MDEAHASGRDRDGGGGMLHMGVGLVLSGTGEVAK